MYDGETVLFEFTDDSTERVITEPSVSWSITVVDTDGRESEPTDVVAQYIAPPGGVSISITIERLSR